MPNHTFELTTDYIDNSGGHAHITPRRTRNRENYGHAILRRTTTDYDFPYEGQTQADGREEFDYIASLWGDTIKICLQSRQHSLLCDTIKIVEKVLELIDFRRYRPPTEQMWNFWQSPQGATRHPDNNWCTSDMGDRVQIAIFDFYNWLLSEDGGGVPIILSLNDMSLQLGGRYDIDALWEQVPPGYRPQQRHFYHRTGTSLDVNRRNGITEDQIEQLTTFMENHGLRRNNERPEIHYGLNEEN